LHLFRIEVSKHIIREKGLFNLLALTTAKLLNRDDGIITVYALAL
jgi:hypothetical protein